MKINELRKVEVLGYLKNKCHSNYTDEEMVFGDTTEDIDLIRLPGIELIEYLNAQRNRVISSAQLNYKYKVPQWKLFPDQANFGLT